jgi:vanillate O-demethylase monooxygenase subunit
VVDQTALTFEEDKVIIEAQWRNQQRFPARAQLYIPIDAGPTRARRLIEALVRGEAPPASMAMPVATP